jgi:hypothetical protein
MKSLKNKMQKLALANGQFSGGFTSLDSTQLEKIKGGIDSAVNNCSCTNRCNQQ